MKIILMLIALCIAARFAAYKGEQFAANLAGQIAESATSQAMDALEDGFRDEGTRIVSQGSKSLDSTVQSLAQNTIDSASSMVAGNLR